MSSLTTITYFALKQLIVGNNQMFFLCRFGNIFDVSQQLVLIEKLKKTMQFCFILLRQPLTRLVVAKLKKVKQQMQTFPLLAKANNELWLICEFFF